MAIYQFDYIRCRSKLNLFISYRILINYYICSRGENTLNLWNIPQIFHCNVHKGLQNKSWVKSIPGISDECFFLTYTDRQADIRHTNVYKRATLSPQVSRHSYCMIKKVWYFIFQAKKPYYQIFYFTFLNLNWILSTILNKYTKQGKKLKTNFQSQQK